MAKKGQASLRSQRLRLAPGTDNFEFDTELGFAFTGYNSTEDPTSLIEPFLVRGSLNCYQKPSGTLANRPGRKLVDAAQDNTRAGILAAFIWNTSLGFSYPIREANSKLQFYSTVSGTGAWYTLLSSLTKTRFVFDTYNDNQTDLKDFLVTVNGTAQTAYKWDGGVALFVSAVASTTITLDRDPAANGFASVGTVNINGNTYAYTGINSANKQLTGVTGDASGQAANSVAFSQIVTQSSFTSGPSATYACDFIRVVNNQMYLGSYTSQKVFLSKNTSWTDFSNSATRLTGEGGVITIDAPGKGIGVFLGQAVIFSGTSYCYLISFAQITVGSTLSEQIKQNKYFLGNLVSALGHEFIDSLADNICYLDQANQVRSLGNFKNFYTVKAVLLSLPVLTELGQENFSGGALRVVNDLRGDLVYITAPISGKTYIYTERITLTEQGDVVTQRIWQPPQQWNISRVDSFQAVTIGFSYTNPQMYQLWDTSQWHDDSPSGQLPYTSIALLPYNSDGRRQGKFVFEKVLWEGYATRGSQLYGTVYYDYQGSTTVLTFPVSDQSSPFTDNQIFTGVVPPSLGDGSLGDNPLGDGLNTLPDDQALLPKFRVINDVTPINCFEYALMFSSYNADDRWELICAGVNARIAEDQAAEIRK